MNLATSEIPQANCPENFRVHDHVPMAHVTDVDKSVAFYSLLGFQCDSRFSDSSGRTYYAAISSGQAELMLVLASGPIDANQQAVLFYMYSQDVLALRSHLLGKGIPNAGRVPGARKSGDQDTPIPPGPSLFDLVYPPYMNEGELRVHDPDDYVILIGQCDFRRQTLQSAALASRKIGQIAITVSNVEDAVRFYCEVLGLRLLFSAGPNLAFLSDGALRIMLTTPQGAGRSELIRFCISRCMISNQLLQPWLVKEPPPSVAHSRPPKCLTMNFGLHSFATRTAIWLG